MPQGDYALKVPQMHEAARLYRAGYSWRQIAERFDVSQNAVKNALAYMGVPPRPKHVARAMRWYTPTGTNT